MKTPAFPSLFIVADRGRIVVYQPTPHDHFQKMETIDIPEGLLKLSDQVTDKAGRFPDSSTDGQGNASAERLPLLEEINKRCIRKIVTTVNSLLQDYQVDRWALAAPSEINRSIIDALGNATQTLVLNIPLNLVNAPPDDLKKHVRQSLTVNT